MAETQKHLFSTKWNGTVDSQGVFYTLLVPWESPWGKGEGLTSTRMKADQLIYHRTFQEPLEQYRGAKGLPEWKVQCFPKSLDCGAICSQHLQGQPQTEDD